MFIANQLKDNNRAEYVLYLWQVEDILRAYGCDADRIATDYLSRFANLSPEQMAEAKQWYADLCDMMRSEGVKERGHLQMSKVAIATLADLATELLNSQKFPFFRELYYKVLPYIVELNHKSTGTGNSTAGANVASAAETSVGTAGELETLFDLLYGVMVLRLKKQPVSQETERAVADVAKFLGTLSDYYFKNKANPIDFE